jgi:hypothetical protein
MLAAYAYAFHGPSGYGHDQCVRVPRPIRVRPRPVDRVVELDQKVDPIFPVADELPLAVEVPLIPVTSRPSLKLAETVC